LIYVVYSRFNFKRKVLSYADDRPVTLEPGQSHTYHDPIFKEDAKGRMVSNLLCKDNGDKTVLYWEKMIIGKEPYYIRFEQPGNMEISILLHSGSANIRGIQKGHTSHLVSFRLPLT